MLTENNAFTVELYDTACSSSLHGLVYWLFCKGMRPLHRCRCQEHCPYFALTTIWTGKYKLSTKQQPRLPTVRKIFTNDIELKIVQIRERLLFSGKQWQMSLLWALRNTLLCKDTVLSFTMRHGFPPTNNQPSTESDRVVLLFFCPLEGHITMSQ